MYDIMTFQKPYSDEQNRSKLIKDVCENGIRPVFNVPIPKCYKQLIEQCWSEDPSKRQSFDQIVSELRTNRDFITDTVNEKLYSEYVKFIDEFQVSFNPNKRIQQLDEIINNNKLNTFQDFDIDMGNRDIYKTEFDNILSDRNFDLDDYEIQKKIGKGCFYKVILIKNKTTKENFVAKIPLDCVESFYRHDIINFSQELNLIFQMNHPSILKFIGYSPIDFKRYSKKVIVTEFAPNGSLKSVIEQHETNKYWNDTKRLINIYGIASAMAFLHSNNVLHRDLKPANIFLDKSFYPKLSGFLLSVEIPSNSEFEENKRKGTPLYLSPEVWIDMKYSKSSDVYSFALVIYEILTNKKPFQEFFCTKEIVEEVCIKMKRPLIDDFVPECYKKLIEKCWSQDPKERPTFEMIISELKTNKEFITESIDEKEFNEYIKYIDESLVSFDKTKKMCNLIEFIQTRTWLFKKIDLEIGLNNII